MTDPIIAQVMQVNEYIERAKMLDKIKAEAFEAGWNARTAAIGRWLTHEDTPDLKTASDKYVGG